MLECTAEVNRLAELLSGENDMALALLDEERKLVEGMLAFANRRQITSARKVQWLFCQPKYPGQEQPRDCIRLKRFHQRRLREWLERITKSEAGRKDLAEEIAWSLRRVKAYLVLGVDQAGKRRLSYDYQIVDADPIRAIETGYLAAVALILDESRGLTNRLKQCRWSRCKRFNLDFEPKGRPRTFCDGDHKYKYDLEMGAERVAKCRADNKLKRQRLIPIGTSPERTT